MQFSNVLSAAMLLPLLALAHNHPKSSQTTTTMTTTSVLTKTVMLSKSKATTTSTTTTDAACAARPPHTTPTPLPTHAPNATTSRPSLPTYTSPTVSGASSDGSVRAAIAGVAGLVVVVALM